MRQILAGLFCSAAAIGGLALGSASAQAQAQPFYQGKTLTMIVGLAAGGSADTLVRQLTPHLRKQIPGEPSIVVQNMPGAGGVLAFNYIYEKAPRDGTQIIFSLWDPLAQALGNQGLRARYDQYPYLGGIADVRVNYLRVDAVPGGFKQPADIMKAPNLIVGAYGTTDLSGILAHLSLKMLDVPHKIVTGYRGGSDVFLAMQRGEVNFHNTSLATFRTRSKGFVQSGDGAALSYLVASNEKGEYLARKDVTDMPVFQDLYKQVHGKLPAGPLWNAFNWTVQQFGDLAYVGLAPPGTPEPALAVLRKAIADTMADKDFIEETTKRNGLPFDYVNMEEGAKVFKALSGASPEILSALRESMAAMGAK
jgi:tripartite-type tricarboxylate transporter receptor subunit TctC